MQREREQSARFRACARSPRGCSGGQGARGVVLRRSHRVRASLLLDVCESITESLIERLQLFDILLRTGSHGDASAGEGGMFCAPGDGANDRRKAKEAVASPLAQQRRVQLTF